MLKRMLSFMITLTLVCGGAAPVFSEEGPAFEEPFGVGLDEQLTERLEAESQLELLNDVQSLLRDMDESYSARYLVKERSYARSFTVLEKTQKTDGLFPVFSQMILAKAEEAFEAGKAEKAQKVEAQSNDPEQLQAMRLELPDFTASSAMREDVTVQTVMEYTVITLPEKIDPEPFMEQMRQVSDIEYIQLDYRISLSASGKEVFDLSGLETPLETEFPERENTEHPEGTKDSEFLTPSPIPVISVEPEESTELPAPSPFEPEGPTASPVPPCETVIPEQSLPAEKPEIESADPAAPVIALLDSCVDTSHPDLQGHFYSNPAEIQDGTDTDGNGYIDDLWGWDFVNDRPEVYDAATDAHQTHGTHLAGVIASAAPDAKLLPLKVFEEGAAYTSDLIRAIAYAEDQGAVLANCSWGSTENNQALQEAMEQSEMLFVCAVGNNRLDLEQTLIYPACFDLDNVLAVTSVNEDGGLSYFSNYSETKADLAAWGRAVESTFPEGQYGKLSGTSVSAAQVSGALASCWTDLRTSREALFAAADKLVNLQEYVAEGRRLNLSNFQNGITSTQVQDINPVEDFDTEAYSMTPEESWELFTSLENVAVTAGYDFLAVLKADGSVWTWGSNDYGQLGNFSNTASTVPQRTILSQITQIAAGEYHMAAVNRSGIVYTWGRNTNGALGLGTTANASMPMAVNGVSGCTKVGAGSANTYMITGSGLYVCGDNTYGQVGDGTNANRATPVKITIEETIKEITGGGGSTFALGTSGALYAWGDNAYGKLGDGTQTQRILPVKVISSGVKQVNTGGSDCIAVMEDGSVYLWGYGFSTRPAKDPLLSDVTKAVSGQQTQFVLQENTIRSRGTNSYGILGTGSTSSSAAYRAISGEFTDFAVRRYMAAAIGTNGCVYVWGQITPSNYVTSPIMTGGDINALAGNSFETAALITKEGLIRGNLLYGRSDYYKFVPSYDTAHLIYSLSSNMDLACKIYRQNYAANTYDLIYSNDDSTMGISPNSKDFYIQATLHTGNTYYINVYPATGNGGEYELYLEQDAGTDSYVIQSNAGEESELYINLANAGGVDRKEITISYPSDQLELADACAFTQKPDTAVGVIAGTNLEIVSAVPGTLQLKIHQTVPPENVLSAAVSIVRFKALTDGSKTVTCRFFAEGGY